MPKHQCDLSYSSSELLSSQMILFVSKTNKTKQDSDQEVRRELLISTKSLAHPNMHEAPYTF